MKRPPPRHRAPWDRRVVAGRLLWPTAVLAALGATFGLGTSSAPKVAASSVSTPVPQHVTGVRGLPTYATAPVMSVGVVASETVATPSAPPRAPRTTQRVVRTRAKAPATAGGALVAIPEPSPAPTPSPEPPVEDSPVDPAPVGDVGAGESPVAVTPPDTIDATPSPTPSMTPTPVEGAPVSIDPTPVP
jgi:hypothetical protein